MNLPQGITATVAQNDMAAEIAALKAENEALKAKAAPKLGIKVSEKGAVSVYGLGRFPVTLYGSQWTQLFERREEIEAFIKANADKLQTRAKKVG